VRQRPQIRFGEGHSRIEPLIRRGCHPRHLLPSQAWPARLAQI